MNSRSRIGTIKDVNISSLTNTLKKDKSGLVTSFNWDFTKKEELFCDAFKFNNDVFM